MSKTERIERLRWMCEYAVDNDPFLAGILKKEIVIFNHPLTGVHWGEGFTEFEVLEPSLSPIVSPAWDEHERRVLAEIQSHQEKYHVK